MPPSLLFSLLCIKKHSVVLNLLRPRRCLLLSSHLSISLLLLFSLSLRWLHHHRHLSLLLSIHWLLFNFHRESKPLASVDPQTPIADSFPSQSTSLLETMKTRRGYSRSTECLNVHATCSTICLNQWSVSHGPQPLRTSCGLSWTSLLWSSSTSRCQSWL